MKTPFNPTRRKGFTLVELLVVISIIAVLAAAGFAGGSAAMNKARKVTAQAAATSINTAVEQFYTEYSALPDVGDDQVETNGVEGIDLLNILAAQETATPGTPPQNVRQIRFLSVKEAKSGNRDGAVYGAAGDITGMYDPWGQPYYIVLDDDYDERLTFTPGVLSSVTLNGKRVAVYSLGVTTPGDETQKSLVKTW